MGCACHASPSGLGDAAPLVTMPRRFANIERVFAEYIAANLKAGTPFYISPQLNNVVLQGVDPNELLDMFPTNHITVSAGLGQFEFLLPIFSAIAGAASAAGTAIIAAAPAIGSIAGSISALTSAGIAANNVLNQAGAPSIIPAAIITPTAQAASQDVNAAANSSGLSTDSMLLIGGAFLLALIITR